MKYLILPLFFVATSALACPLLSGTYYNLDEKGCGWAYDISTSLTCKNVRYREYPVGGSNCEIPSGNYSAISAPIDGKTYKSGDQRFTFTSTFNVLQVTVEGECNEFKNDMIGRLWVGPCGGEGYTPFQLKRK